MKLLQSHLFWGTCVCVMGLLAMMSKHHVAEQEEYLENLNRKILAEQSSLHILEAEWSYLNQPDYLQAMSQRFLQLKPLMPQQRIDVRDLMQASTQSAGTLQPIRLEQR